jgi:hypothetical protein
METTRKINQIGVTENSLFIEFKLLNVHHSTTTARCIDTTDEVARITLSLYLSLSLVAG